MHSELQSAVWPNKVLLKYSNVTVMCIIQIHHTAMLRLMLFIYKTESKITNPLRYWLALCWLTTGTASAPPQHCKVRTATQCFKQ